MRKLTFRDLAIKVLEKSNIPLTAEGIWEYAVANNMDILKQSIGKTPWRTIKSRIYVDIKNNPDTPFIKIDSKPKTFYLKKLAGDIELKDLEKKAIEIIEKPKQKKYSEREVHPFLVYFANTYLDANCKTIKHERSSKKRYTKWLHPDIVGVNFPIEDWSKEVLDFGLVAGRGNLITLFSFELKLELNFSNLRESYFQAVSNSSWSNYGFLVATKVLRDDEFEYELARLSTAFGIGIIKLDIDDPDSSEVLFDARLKEDLDWETINKLAQENRDFKEFIVRVKNDLTTKEIRKESYDKVLEIEALEKIIKK
ncbi:HTH domain-containing protein [Seonamhaeicola sp.]|uniref:COG2958 family protein n=1 Tax=Seonamhaeicola sp. TaxID=1912245 RepID=UPI00261CE6E7|nr:HTH domain-containing protein [Seonamhaeicola sp.]